MPGGLAASTELWARHPQARSRGLLPRPTTAPSREPANFLEMARPHVGARAKLKRQWRQLADCPAGIGDTAFPASKQPKIALRIAVGSMVVKKARFTSSRDWWRDIGFT